MKAVIVKKTDINSLKNVIEKLDKFSSFKVNGLNASQLIELENESPEVFDKISAFIKEGRWYPLAGMYKEKSENISDEKLLRNVLYSTEYLTKAFSKTFKAFYGKKVYTCNFAQTVYNSRFNAAFIEGEKDMYWLDTQGGMRTLVIGAEDFEDAAALCDSDIESGEFFTLEEYMNEVFSSPLDIKTVTAPYEKAELKECEKLLLEAETVYTQNGEDCSQQIKALWLEAFDDNCCAVKKSANEILNGRCEDATFFNINKENVKVCAYKYAQDGSGDKIIRVKETAGKETSVRFICDSINAGFLFEINPYEVITFRVDSEGFVKETFIQE